MENQQLYLFNSQKSPEPAHQERSVFARPDILILSGVVVLLIGVGSFSLGVERGKRMTVRSYRMPAQAPVLPDTQAPSVQQELSGVPSAVRQAEVPSVQQPTAVQQPQLRAQETGAAEKSGYNIQVASFAQEQSANVAAQVLREKGYPVEVSKKGKFFGVYVGTYESEREAQNIMQSLKKTYKDCILRRL